ncbi:MAG: 30S ribosomal protein S8 [Ignavibacteriae bacterium]|nr:30S ribosomal protein S8 [Ignavibacteriota bacterium]
MSMTDPIADFLTRMRNAIKAEKKTVDIPLSKMKAGIADILKRTSYITDYSVVENDGKKYLSVKLKYNNGRCVIEGLRRVSKPGIRRYVKYEKLPRVRNGLGVAVVSTSKGLITEKEARKLQIGGEVVCAIW